MRNKTIKTVLSVLVFVAITALAVWYIRGHAEAFKKIFEIDLQSFLILSALCTLAILASGLQMNAIVSIFNTRITVWEGFGLSAMNTMANFYFAKAGLAAKAVYLKKKHDFNYAKFLSALAGAYVVSVIAQGVVGLSAYLLVARGQAFRIEFVLIFSGLIISGLLPLVLPSLSIKPETPFIGKFARVFEGWEQVRRHHRALGAIAVLNVTYAVIGAARLLVSYSSVGHEVDFLSCLVMAPLSTVTMITSVTPGAVGIRQALVGYGSRLLDIGMTEGVVASTVDHAVGTVWVFVFGLIFSLWIGIGRIKG